jgi:lysophospholipase L1-like esterase
VAAGKTEDAPMRKVMRYAALASFAVVVSIVGLELTLQGAALVVGATGRDPVTGWISGNTRVLALGDSNTYGLFLPPEQSWPTQFEAIWNAEVESPKIEVINLGYPGTNSSVLLKNLPGFLDTFRPDVVLVMVGVNDFWTDTVSREEVPENALDRATTWLRQNSRVYKLAFMIGRGFYDPEELDLGERSTLAPDAIDARTAERITEALLNSENTDLSEVRYGDRKFELGYVRGSGEHGNFDSLKDNLRTIAQEIADGGGYPILLTYPASKGAGYGRANQATRQVTKQTGVRMIDISRAVAESCPDPRKCPDLFFPDHHAKQPGYTIAARKLVKDLRAAGPLADRP